MNDLFETLKMHILPEEITQDEVDRVVNYFIATGILKDLVEKAKLIKE